ncbi:MAG TPA: class I SAM-dependent methyltransferase [Reyranella sp.]|nr:class I SAM-dependent methyltransferase [Reyranella sp.]HLM10928.1 class I SAM-dependent methyltransferase [Reyranella sp.]
MVDSTDGRQRGLACCRSCSSKHLTVFLDLGRQPLANALLNEHELEQPEPRFPLQLAFCHDCGLVQVTETIPPDVLFGRDYPYFSSFSPALLRHSREHVQRILQERRLGPASLVVEVASNDGYLLQNFIDAGVPVLGVDPAAGPVASARERGVPTLHAFFGAAIARELAAKGQRADIMIANNVVAHVDGINDFIEGFAILLKDDGIARIEVAYLRDMIEKCEFDTVYHEHLFYWSISAMERLVARHGLQLNDAERLPIHGGSIRFTLSRRPGRSRLLEALLAEEAALGMGDIAYYVSFAARVEELRSALRESVRQIRADGRRLAAYGAAAKGATLLNYMEFKPGVIEYVVDRNPAKVGKYLPGVKLPIRPVEMLAQDKPDYVLVLAWNFAREIIGQNQDYTSAGGKFILPVEERPSL